jgi:hypothetical protein
MPIIEGAAGAPLQSAGVPGVGTDEIQTITITGTPTGGTFTLTFEGFTTAPIAYNAAAAAVDAALELLPSIGTNTLTCGGNALPGTPVTVTFQFNRGRQAVPLMTAVASFTGGTTPAIAVTESTPGVDAFGRGALKGSLVTDTTNGKLYINTGTAITPVWTVVGSQS